MKIKSKVAKTAEKEGFNYSVDSQGGLGDPSEVDQEKAEDYRLGFIAGAFWIIEQAQKVHEGGYVGIKDLQDLFNKE